MTTVDTLNVYVRNAIVDLRVGVYAQEKAAAQPVSISVELIVPLTRRFDNPSEDSLSAIVDYGALYRFITENLPQRSHTPFLETIAEAIMDFGFADPRVTTVCVQLEKTQIFDSTARAGITLQRTRTT